MVLEYHRSRPVRTCARCRAIVPAYGFRLRSHGWFCPTNPECVAAYHEARNERFTLNVPKPAE